MPTAGCNTHAASGDSITKRLASEDLNPAPKKKAALDYVVKLNQIMQENSVMCDALLTNYSSYFYDSVEKCNPISLSDFEHAFRPISDIRWEGVGCFKGHGISMHPLIISSTSGDTCKGLLIKGSQFGGRDAKLQHNGHLKPVGLGFGVLKFVQHAIIFFNEFTLHVALTSMEKTNKMTAERINREYLVAKNFAKQDSKVKECVVLPFYFGGGQRTGVAHDTKKSGVKMGCRVPKAYGIMPVISNGDAFSLAINGTVEQKHRFVVKALSCMRCLTQNGIIHGDIKPENFSWYGDFLDIGSVTFLNEEVVFSGTKGYFSLLQQCKSDGLVSLLGGRLSISPQLIRQLKQWQDSFGFSATIFFVLVGQLLNEKHKTFASKAEFDSCIRHCADKIIKADFPYPYQQAQALKELMLDMAGVNPNPPYSNGMGVIGDALVARIDDFLDEFSETANQPHQKS
ncbi:MAG: hypothetical protein ISP52_05090 [Flavobacteriaceae bacterium]|nr:hypothetical protein [Flavobacteriaceae bacterium]